MIIVQLSCLHLSLSSSPGWCSHSFRHLQHPPRTLSVTCEATRLQCCAVKPLDVFCSRASRPSLLWSPIVTDRTPAAHGACEWESDRWGIENQTANLGPLQKQHRLRLQLYTQSFNVMLILIAKLDWFLKKKNPFCHRFLQMGIRLLNRLRVTWLRCACFRSLTPDTHRGSPLKCHVERSHCGSSWCQTDASLALLPHRI